MKSLRWTNRPLTRRLLPIAVAFAVLFGTALLCLGNGDYKLLVIVACAVGVSFYVTEWSGIMALSPLVANLAALVAMGVTAVEFVEGGREMQLIAIANLLVYLQVILLFQKKTARVYWQIILLSLLQVVVGAALSLSAYFGLMLIGFIGLAAFVLHVFFMADELGQLPSEGSDSPSGPHGGAPTVRGGALGQEDRPIWPYANRELDLQPAVAGADARSHRQASRYFTSVLSSLLFTAPVAMLVFFTVPRFGKDPWRAGPAAQQRAVGFSQEVRLGQLGSALEDPQVVMRVKFIDPRRGVGMKLVNTPMLRGTVVTKYEEGRWTHHGNQFETTKDELPSPPRTRDVVTQEISLEPLSEPVVFSVYPAYAASPQRVVFDIDRQQLVREPERLQRSQLNLQLETTGIVNGRQTEVTPARRRLRPGSFRHFRLTSLPRFQDRQRSLSTIGDVAQRALEDAQAADADVYTVCKTLERYLQRDGGFTYTLTEPARTPGLDPVEDFVANNRTGHCEYFASALALMLRSRGIPARVVIGYQGGEWNDVGRFYQFRQLHTHSWVEAYLTREQLEGHIDDPSPYPRGGWLRMDPTAVTLAPQSGAATGMLSRMRQAKAYAELVWVKYVVGMTSRRQQQTLYDPIQNAFQSLLDPVTLVMSVEARARGWIAYIRDWLRGNWFSWRGGMAAMLVSLLLVGASWCVRWAVRTIRPARRRQQDERQARRSTIPFYERLEEMFASLGIRRAAGQTQREFALSLGGHLAESPETKSHAGLPKQIADAFYGVRFGQRSISTSQEQELTAALASLERSLRSRPR